MFGLAGLITAIMTTLTIELTIRRNGIQDVDQLSKTSQLIPFVIGLASLLGVIRDVAVDTIDPVQYSYTEIESKANDYRRTQCPTDGV